MQHVSRKSFWGIKWPGSEAGHTHLHLVIRSRMVELHFCSSTCLRGVGNNYLRTGKLYIHLYDHMVSQILPSVEYTRRSNSDVSCSRKNVGKMSVCFLCCVKDQRKAQYFNSISDADVMSVRLTTRQVKCELKWGRKATVSGLFWA
jgi:hypothetical protein